MSEFPSDNYTEPQDVDVDTLANLGPLTALAGIWEGIRGVDVNPKPIDPQANGPQLFYGLRYHTHVIKPGEVETYHDQVALAVGKAAANARSFEVTAQRGSTEGGICSTAFLEHAFTTIEFRIKVQVNVDGTWSYEEDMVMQVKGQAAPFHHTGRNRLTRIGAASPNPLARAGRR